MTWEFVAGEGWYVVEYDGMLRTGPFATKEAAAKWFREELDREIGDCLSKIGELKASGERK